MDFKCGLEVHGYLLMEKSRQKLFCTCVIDRNAPPNTTICPRCTGQPGSIPMVANKEAVDKIVACGLLLGCTIQNTLLFQRKHYSWPDLPNGYQRTMSGSYSNPVGLRGNFLDIGITQVHLEEDPAKWDPLTGFVDYNRSGYPLIEIVTDPDFRSAEQVEEWLKNLLTTLSYIHAVESNAGIKCDVNVSIPNHPRVEIKNVNSIQAIKLAIVKEVSRQQDALAKGEQVLQHTRTPPDEHGRTEMMRTKEQAQDYQFIPDPDMPVILLHDHSIRVIEKQLPESPEQKKKQYMKLGLDRENASIIASDIVLAELFEIMVKKTDVKHALRWMRHELLRVVNSQERTLHELQVSPQHIASVVEMAHTKSLTDAAAINVLEQVVLHGLDPLQYVHDNDLRAVDNADEIKALCKKVIEANAQIVMDYRSGKEKALNSLMGKVMKESNGKAKPDMVLGVLRELIS